MDYTIRIGGEAGQGIQTIGDALARVFVRAGHHVFTNQDYESRIRGGHNFYQVRLSDRPVSAPTNRIDILVALDRESIARHGKDVVAEGRVLYDAATLKVQHSGDGFLDAPLDRLARELGGSGIMANTVATGAVLGMLGMDIGLLLALIEESFRPKGEAVIAANRRAAQAGHDHAVRNCTQCRFGLAPSPAKKRMLIGGTEAIALGALASDCRFYSAYPMTPSTGIMNYLASKEKEYGIVVEQAEDEIAAVNMALGASFAGVRAMTGTSGGGFALMVEGVSLAGMTETPIVIAMGQRPGPATGFPTRTEQGDLQMVLAAGHGEFPRIVFAPGTPQQAFHLTNKAFDLAEKYQVPAFILFDTHLADTQWTFDGFDLSRLTTLDYRVRGDAFRRLADYKRYAWTGSGISLFGVPGDARHLVVADSDEHDADGHIVEDAATRIAMTKKRLLNKLPLIRREIAGPYLYGDQQPEVVLTGWGSTFGVLKEAVDVLSRSVRTAMLHFSEISPLPSRDRFDYVRLLAGAKHALCVENNATGQFARLLRSETGFEFTGRINKYDGRPFTIEGLTGEVHGHLGGV